MSARLSNAGEPSPKVLAAAANGVTEMIGRYGGDVERIFGRATLRAQELQSPVNELSLRQYCALFEEAARLTGQDNFGLHFGQEFAPRRLGAIGYIAIASPTLAAGLANLVRYFPAHQDSSLLELEEDGELLRLTYRIHDPRIDARRQDAELSLGMFCNIFRHGLGARWAPVAVHFEHPRPDDPEEHERQFNAPVLFGQRTNAIVFRRANLAAPMPGSDPFLFAVIEPFLAERRPLRDGPVDFASALTREIKRQLADGRGSLGSIAAQMGMTPSGLQRRLRAQGVTFADFLRAARQEMALRHVRDSDMPLTEVALAVGYSELSAFSRAFRTWTGLSPQRYRRQHRAAGGWPAMRN